MRAVVQRVKHASVTIDNEVVGKINQGFMVLLGITHDDTVEDVDFLVNKCVNLRAFTDENDKMNNSLLDVNGEMLVVSQFTLYGDCRKGRRPSFIDAARPELADPLYRDFVKKVRGLSVNVQTGEFGADMKVELLNDGPVTLIIESPAKK